MLASDLSSVADLFGSLQPLPAESLPIAGRAILWFCLETWTFRKHNGCTQGLQLSSRKCKAKPMSDVFPTRDPQTTLVAQDDKGLNRYMSFLGPRILGIP